MMKQRGMEMIEEEFREKYKYKCSYACRDEELDELVNDAIRFSPYKLDTEIQIQKKIVEYIRLTRPDVLFRANIKDSGKITPRQGKQLQLAGASRGWPDLFIAEPRGHYHGLFVEIKKDKNVLFTKSGRLRQNKHIIDQESILGQLRLRGYKAEFSTGFECTINLIDEYLGKNTNN